MRFVAFDLGLSLGEVTRISERSERGTPELENAFVWRIRCSGTDVTVFGHDGSRVVQLGTARWDAGELTACEGKSADFPNDYQWDLIAYGLGKALGESVRGRGRDMFEGGRRAPRVSTRPAAPGQIAARDAMAEARAKRRLAVTAIAIGILGVVMVFVFASARGRSTSSTPEPAPPRPAPAPRPEPIEQRVASAASLTEAIAMIGSRLGDGANNQGAWLLARFASRHLVWDDVAEPETTIGLVLKDSERERGKRSCASGGIRDIERKDLDHRPVYVGVLDTAEGDAVRFIAVGSTGTLVKRSTGTICGIATGKDAKAMVIVGLFDLPENRQPAVER